jgi:aminoglycoside 6-adenylyltransferase
MGQDEGTERILSKMVAWATARNDLRGIAVVGSRARSDHPADAWSDLDIVVMARRPGPYLAGPRWLDAIETPWLAVKEPTPIGGQEIFLVTFEGGTKVDVVVVSSRAFAVAARVVGILRHYPAVLSLMPGIACDRLFALSDVLNRGLRMVLDKDGIARHLESGGLPMLAPVPPSQEEFLDLVSRFLNEQVWVALKIRRGELFVAKTLGESRLLALLLRMIEWHAQATTDRWSAVYEHGRFLEEWAAPEVVRRLRAVFPRYDASDILNARIAALDLFRQLAEETGARLGYAYPRKLEDTVMNWVRTFAEESEGGRPPRRRLGQPRRVPPSGGAGSVR